MTLLIDEPALVDRPAGVVLVTGPDRASYLHTLLSQHLEGTTPGSAADFLYLDAKGGIRALGRALVREEDILLVTPPEVAGDLAAALEQYKFMLQVAATDVSDEWARSSGRGPAEVVVPGAADVPMTFLRAQGRSVVVRDRSGGVDLVGPTDEVATAAAGLPLARATAADYETWRIQAGEPAWGSEVVAGRRAQELGLLPTHVHLRKGCYPGQESIAKIYNLGRPRRALAVVDFTGPVAPGDDVASGAKRGTITSAAPLDHGWIALALVPLDREGEFADGGDVRVGAISGRVRKRVGLGLPQPGAPESGPRTGVGDGPGLARVG